jgi:hypothetical protein
VSDFYRQRAQYCHQMAKQASTQQLKADWLGIAETWLHLAAEKAVTKSADVVPLKVVAGG